ncbi:hypothetical protein NHQ30_000891 [Ciborinia camelliae]|nr:hypothetical protein NHQ30_000891 [Ciborinia camelliae]
MKFSSLCYIAGLAPFLSQACLLPEEIEGKPRIARRQTSNGLAIGAGDRFHDGTIAPRGVGTSPRTINSILSVKEIASGMKGLANAYNITTFTTPYKTFEKASIMGGTVGGYGKCNDAIRVYLNGAIHARERGSADGLLFFIGDLLYANKNGLGLTFGKKSYTHAQVVSALSTGIVFIPLSNPDGVAYDQATNSCWRKNRNPKSGTGDNAGVDLNRNFDILWDMSHWSNDSQLSVASIDPADETFHGTAPFSEPETQSIKWVLDTYSKVNWFIDLHSFTGDVLYAWGSETNQVSDPKMNFLNATYNSVRGDLSDTPGVGTGYGEYIPAAENATNVAVALNIGAGMSAAAGREYKVIPAAELYPTSGSSDDYAYSRHFSDPTKSVVHSYTVEFGFGNQAASCPFYPTKSQHNNNMAEIGAGYMELLLSAVKEGLGDAKTC